MTRSITSRWVAPSPGPRLYVLVLVLVLVVAGLSPEAAVAVVGGCLAAAVEVALRLSSAPAPSSAR